jgi:hypothetical protein
MRERLACLPRLFVFLIKIGEGENVQVVGVLQRTARRRRAQHSGSVCNVDQLTICFILSDNKQTFYFVKV